MKIDGVVQLIDAADARKLLARKDPKMHVTFENNLGKSEFTFTFYRELLIPMVFKISYTDISNLSSPDMQKHFKRLQKRHDKVSRDILNVFLSCLAGPIK